MIDTMTDPALLRMVPENTTKVSWYTLVEHNNRGLQTVLAEIYINS
jgi:hypothetical protein